MYPSAQKKIPPPIIGMSVEGKKEGAVPCCCDIGKQHGVALGWCRSEFPDNAVIR